MLIGLYGPFYSVRLVVVMHRQKERLSHPFIPIAGPIAMCYGSERYPVEYTVITGNYLRSNINNSCLECSLILSMADGGRIM